MLFYLFINRLPFCHLSVRVNERFHKIGFFALFFFMGAIADTDHRDSLTRVIIKLTHLKRFVAPLNLTLSK